MIRTVSEQCMPVSSHDARPYRRDMQRSASGLVCDERRPFLIWTGRDTRLLTLDNQSELFPHHTNDKLGRGDSWHKVSTSPSAVYAAPSPLYRSSCMNYARDLTCNHGCKNVTSCLSAFMTFFEEHVIPNPTYIVRECLDNLLQFAAIHARVERRLLYRRHTVEILHAPEISVNFACHDQHRTAARFRAIE